MKRRNIRKKNFPHTHSEQHHCVTKRLDEVEKEENGEWRWFGQPIKKLGEKNLGQSIITNVIVSNFVTSSVHIQNFKCKIELVSHLRINAKVQTIFNCVYAIVVGICCQKMKKKKKKRRTSASHIRIYDYYFYSLFCITKVESISIVMRKRFGHLSCTYTYSATKFIWMSFVWNNGRSDGMRHIH